MELAFDVVQQIGSGAQPFAMHTPENIVQVTYVGENGSIFAKEASVPMGQWKDLEFSPAYMICDDVNVEHMKLKYVAGSIFVVWKNATIKDEVVPYVPGVVNSMRHRFAVWEMRQDLSKYLIDGDISFRLDDPVASLNINFENPKYAVSQEEDTILTPGTCITLFFRSGDSARYIMGRYYVDRNSMGVTDSDTSVSGRNSIGKLLKDQSFDDENNYPLQNLKTLGETLLKSFGIKNYFVGTTTDSIGMQFPPDMSGLDGFQELIKAEMSWKIAEDMTGCVGFADKSDPRFSQPSTYTFYRGTDVFSRNVDRDDMDAYSRVCVCDRNYTIKVYRDVSFKFVMGRKKTLYVSIAEGTVQADAEKYADEIASLLSSVGVIETFVGPFRPHLLVGDNAQIIGQTTRLLGLITSVKHKFGKSGFSTEFVVDSGSTANKTRVSDYINKITSNKSTGQATRLY